MNFKLNFKILKGENLFKCDNCEKLFRHKCTLKNHERIHTGWLILV